MSPAKKTAAKKKTTKKATARKAPAKKKPAKKAAKKKATKKKVAKKTTKAAKKKTQAKKAPAKKAAAKKAVAKKASKKKATAKKATQKKVVKKKAEEPAPARPKNPGKLVVARGKQVSKLGDRWTCWGCEAVFYDLNQPRPTCPKCGQDQMAKQGASEEKKKKKPTKRDSMRALRVLDDDDGPAPTADTDSGAVEMDLELGTDEKLLEQADKVAETDED